MRWHYFYFVIDVLKHIEHPIFNNFKNEEFYQFGLQEKPDPESLVPSKWKDKILYYGFCAFFFDDFLTLLKKYNLDLFPILSDPENLCRNLKVIRDKHPEHIKRINKMIQYLYKKGYKYC